jgi:hypothetical protein
MAQHKEQIQAGRGRVDMTRQATEKTVFDVVKNVLPDGTNGEIGTAGESAWDSVCQWPPDLFAAMAAVTERSGLYSEQPFTSYWVDDRFLPTKDWIEKTREIGREWSKSGKPPEIVQTHWRDLMGRMATAPIDADDTASESWKKLVFQLLAIADESCAGIGFSPGLPAAGIPADEAGVPFMFQNEYTIWSERYKADRKAIGGDYLIHLPHSLCMWVPPETCCVQPKTNTPTVGCTLRSLTHHLALLPSIANVATYWHVAHERKKTEGHAFNLLLVPFPYSVPGKSFAPVPGDFPGASKNKVFRLNPEAWMRKATPKQFAKFLLDLAKAAKSETEPVNAIVLPETALLLDFADKVAKILAESKKLDLLVTGVITDKGSNACNSAAIYRFVDGDVLHSSLQSKHHRWGLEDDQIRRYHLGHVLDPRYKWWEQIDVGNRECHVMLFHPFATLSVLICEDLARYDPVLTVMNAIGPNLVIALLMDGPQLEHRWPGRYATVLAEDPGSAVLTLTSLGMVTRSSMPAEDQSRGIALWKEPTGKAQPLKLPKGDHALLLSLTGRRIEQFTLDGRGDGGATVHFGLGAAHGVRHPSPPPWLGPMP